MRFTLLLPAVLTSHLLIAGCGQPEETPPPVASKNEEPVAPEQPLPAPPCEGKRTTESELTLESSGEVRTWFLHVPASYDCNKPTPILFDFHGTAGAPAPEEAYALEDAVALADELGFILVRPRSRSSFQGGQEIFRWDQNPGDLARNKTFALDLLEHLGSLYHLAPDQRFALGFSSGTNMIAQFLGDAAPVFQGLALIGGGYWDRPALPTFDAEAPRIYSITGYRDYMHTNLRPLLSDLDKRGYPSERLFLREADTGHELYGWHYREAFDWLSKGVRPGAPVSTATWSAEGLPLDVSLLELAIAPSGELFAAATDGAILRRSTAGEWTVAMQLPPTSRVSLTDLCFLPGGKGFAAGELSLLATEDFGVTWSHAGTVPEFGAYYFGTSYLNALACSGETTVLGGGYWTGVRSEDAGASWNSHPMLSFDWPAQIATLEVSPSTGTVVAAGYYYAGRSVGGGAFGATTVPWDSSWYTDVAAATDGTFWMVGDHGKVLRSTNDGATWQTRLLPTSLDLYGVASLDADTAAVVGARGAVFLTRDGGASWSDLSLGVDVFLGDVTFLDEASLLVAGERGTVAKLGL